MSRTFNTVEDAFMALADFQGPDWMAAFSFLAAHPDSAQMMLETFRETLEEMGAEPSGVDPTTGEPVYTLIDVAQALGIPEAELDAAVRGADGES